MCAQLMPFAYQVSVYAVYVTSLSYLYLPLGTQ